MGGGQPLHFSTGQRGLGKASLRGLAKRTHRSEQSQFQVIHGQAATQTNFPQQGKNRRPRTKEANTQTTAYTHLFSDAGRRRKGTRSFWGDLYSGSHRTKDSILEGAAEQPRDGLLGK